MPLPPISLNKLLILIDLLECGSVSGAARRLNRTQPSVSKALADLRAYYDDPLLVRDGSALAPSPFASDLLAGLTEWRQCGDALLSRRAKFEPGMTQRQFLIRCSDYHLTAFGPLVRDIALRYGPATSFQLLQPAASLDQDYQRLSFDFAFQVNAKLGPSFERRAILSEPYVIVYDPAKCTAPHDMDSFCAAVFVLASPAGSGPSVVDRHLAKLGRSREVRIRVPLISDAARLVCGTPFISVLPASTGAFARANLSLATAPLLFDVPSITSYLVWAKARSADPAIAWLAEKLASAHFTNDV
ncbi:MAG: LysR family transcriptional regulator [Hyphomicrobiales bacterium]|jgi:DNA-binding transcriptional LysR family regulator